MKTNLTCLSNSHLLPLLTISFSLRFGKPATMTVDVWLSLWNQVAHLNQVSFVKNVALTDSTNMSITALLATLVSIWWTTTALSLANVLAKKTLNFSYNSASTCQLYLLTPVSRCFITSIVSTLFVAGEFKASLGFIYRCLQWFPTLFTTVLNKEVMKFYVP
jgi:hypothetical protein